MRDISPVFSTVVIHISFRRLGSWGVEFEEFEQQDSSAFI
jgi:hypothetical protein